MNPDSLHPTLSPSWKLRYISSCVVQGKNIKNNNNTKKRKYDHRKRLSTKRHKSDYIVLPGIYSFEMKVPFFVLLTAGYF